MTDGIDINILTGKAKDIALNIDAQNVKDNKLSDKEISIFLSECEKNYPHFPSGGGNGKKYRTDRKSVNPHRHFTAPPQ